MVFSIDRIRATNVLTWRDLDLIIPQHSVLGIQGGNYTGKSNLIDIILIALYNRTIRSHVKSSWVTDGEKTWSTTLNFCVGVEKYKIVRGGKTNSFQLGNSTPVLGVSAVNEKMSEILKCSFSQFVNVGYLGQNRLTSVASATDGDRRSLLEPLSNLPDFKLLKNQARYDVASLGRQLSVYEDRVSRLERQIEKALQVGGRDLQELNKKRDDLLQSLSEDQVYFNKVKALVRRLDASVDDVTDTIGTLKLSIQEHNSKIKNYQLMVSVLNSADSRCPSCFSFPTPESRKEALKFTEDQISIHESYRAKSISERAKQSDFQKEESYRMFDARKVKKDLQDKFVILTSELKVVNKSLESLKLNKDLSSLRKLLALAKRGRLSCIEDLKYSGFWVGALGGKGIPSHLLKGVVGTLSQRVTTYLNDILPGVRVNFFHSEEKGTVRCEVIRGNGVVQSFNALSGAQRRLVDIACSFSMRDIAAEKSGSVSDFLMCDEIFDSLDSNHMEGVQQWLTKLKSVTVLLVSHSDNLKDWFPNVKKVKFSESRGSYFE